MRIAIHSLALSFLALSSVPAFSQATTSSSSGQATAQAIAIAPGMGTAGDPSGASGGYPYSGHTTSTQTIQNTPDVAIASYAGGANPCGIGGTLGVAVAGFGIGGGVATTSHECSMRAWYILLATTAEHAHNPVYLQWATGIACANSDLKAVAPAGVCAPVPVATAEAAPAAQPAKLAQAGPVEVAPRAPAKPDWCSTLSPQDGPRPQCQ